MIDGATQAAERLTVDAYSANETNPAAGQDDFLFIGELAERTGISTQAIRFYEKQALLSPPRHGRFRTYRSSDVQRLKNILLLRRVGLPVAQIKKILGPSAANNNDVLSSAITADLLRKHMEELTSRQAELLRQFEETSTLLGKIA
jgi:DNA-binding transcriptional MerR regulator